MWEREKESKKEIFSVVYQWLSWAQAPAAVPVCFLWASSGQAVSSSYPCPLSPLSLLPPAATAVPWGKVVVKAFVPR